MTRFRAKWEQARNGLSQTSTEEDRRIAWAAATILEFAEMSRIEGREVQLEDVLVSLVSDVALISGKEGIEWESVLARAGYSWPGTAPELLGTSQAARLLRLTPERTAALCAAGTLPAQKIGREWIITSSDLTVFARRRRKPGRPRQTGLK